MNLDVSNEPTPFMFLQLKNSDADEDQPVPDGSKSASLYL